MNPVELILKKRNKGTLTPEELNWLITGYRDGLVREYQMSAFLMAVYFNGMTREETLTLTRCMMESGVILDLSDIPGFKVDKHSTGGVGDKVSLILAPIVAAAGVPVPMISGRGLGHTGGTLDKLESIPGFNTGLDLETYRRQLRETGAVLIGQTRDLAPVDKEMYGLRDVTGTVESIPLISGSIMSKKLAEGIDGLVLDVKTGTGAFMKTLEDSRALAESLVSIGLGFGKETIAYITNMNEPIGYEVGNWLEVRECIDCMNGAPVADLMELTHHLSGTMIYLGKKAGSVEEGIDLSRKMIESGKAMDKWLEIVAAQGGDTAVIKNPGSRGQAPVQVQVKSQDSGFIGGFDSREIGMTGILLKAGRMAKDDVISPLTGITIHKKTGEPVSAGDVLFTVHADSEKTATEAVARLIQTVEIAPAKPEKLPMILETIDRKTLNFPSNL